jgi:hypothetical protein
MNGTGKILVAIVTAATLGGCLGPGASSSPPLTTATGTAAPGVVGTLTLTEFFDEMSAKRRPVCTLDAGADVIDVGRLQLTVVNESNRQAKVAMWRIADSRTYRELQSHITGEQEPPAWVEAVFSVTLGAGEMAAEEGTVRAGVHAIACLWDEGHGQGQTDIALVGPVEVES